MTVFIFLLYLSVGIVLTLPVLPLGREGRGFYLFCAALALALGGVSLALRVIQPDAVGANGHLALAGLPLAAYACYLGGTAAAIFAEIAGRRPRLLTLGAALVGVAAILADTHVLHHDRSIIRAAAWLHPLNAVSSAWLAGSVLTAMILGHYYLVMPKASIEPLMAAFKFSLWGLVVRVILVATASILWWTGRTPGPIDPARLIGDGMFVAQRMLFGLALPASLGYMTWKTIAMRSTQSATGILYVVVFLTLVGEALSVYLSFATTVPI